MSQDIRIWQISQNQELVEIPKAKLDFENRLEDWLEQDITVISTDLLVIGRQVPTDFGGFVDLLCLDRSGDVVIVELKRNQTPREVTAQVLDYASWVQDLSPDRLVEIADNYFRNKSAVNLEQAYINKFGSELPEENLNMNHQMLVVASQIDASSERIIQYLSNRYGVSLNAVTFQHFQTEDNELLARVFLLQPSQVEKNAQAQVSSRKRRLSLEELQHIADTQAVGGLYKFLLENLSPYFNRSSTRLGSVTFKGSCNAGKSVVIFSLVPTESEEQLGLKYRVYSKRFLEHFGLNDEEWLLRILPVNYRFWEYYQEAPPDWRGYEGFFMNLEEASSFLTALAEVSKNVS